MIKIGISFEGVLADMEAHFNLWKQRMSLDVDSLSSAKILNNESFWASVPLKDEAIHLGYHLDQCNAVEAYILTERPERLKPITRSWLWRHDINVPLKNIVFHSGGLLKRYDCRLHELDYYIDSDPSVVNSFIHDDTIPVGVGRREDFESWVQVHDSIIMALLRLGPDIRSEYIWQESH